MLNKTNNRTIRGAFGDDCTGWNGKIIVVFPTTDEFRGKMVPVLRVRIPPPKQATAETARRRHRRQSRSRVVRRSTSRSRSCRAKPASTTSLNDELDDEIRFDRA